MHENKKPAPSPAPDRPFAALLALAYLAVGLLWIAFSDETGILLFSSAEALTRFQTWKGAGFVTATAVLVFVLASRRTRREAAELPLRAGASLRVLLTGLVLVTAAPLVVLLGYNLVRQTHGRVEEANALVQGVASSTATDALATLDQQRRLGRQLAQRPLVQALDAGRCDPLLDQLVSLHGDLANLVVLDARGDAVCAARPDRHVRVAVEALRGLPQGLLSPAFVVPEGFALALTLPLPDGAGSLQLVLAEDMLERLVQADAQQGVSSALVTVGGYVLARDPLVPGLVGRQMPNLARFVEVLQRGGNSLTARGIDGVERFYGMRAVGNSGLVAIAGVDVGRTFGPVRVGVLRALGLTLAVLLAASLLITALVRRIAGPMHALARAAEAVAAGEAERRAPEGGPRELARVARQFNHMLDRLPALEHELRESESRHRTLLEKLARNIPGMIFQMRVHPPGPITLPFASDAIEPMFEVTPEQARIDAAPVFARIHPEDAAGVNRALEEAAARLGPIAIEYRVVLSTGVRHYLTYSQPDRADGGELWHGCTVDVTPLKQAQLALSEANEQLEERVSDRTRELAAANESLEAFSYSVAHDLRAPLRAIEGFADALPGLLQRDPERVRRLVDRIAANTAQMGRMIDGLLAVAHAGKGELAERTVRQEALVREILAQLQPPPCMQVEIGPLPSVHADPASLRQVWWNLLSNAVKFTGRQAQGRIVVGCEPRGSELAFYVRDNGSGFDPAFAGRLFTAFQRLHAADEFEGNGIGLALARRVVERHGGRMWAEGSAGAGATFWFSLPASRAV
ncbi:HAMP domain-containing protein [Ramlibacter sp. G-1-2-2]|uniref:histidine kinase n=1 Tax=Ramlibacter agri TaxID=2728837 RepID=A0A848H401_9BURK|nr:ATP-binding protein [Ramlibacter agri]NML43940.1 HAMP domain-containing protein [Ramlibacter agri]